MKHLGIIFGATILLCAVAHGQTRTIDGDTIEHNGHVIRLAALDCPEMHQPGGREAKAHMMALVRDKGLACAFSGRDRYRRPVGTCFVVPGPPQTVLNSLTCQMIRSGLCRRYARYDRAGVYAGCER